jgi:putative ABC transport system permease protein
MSTYRRFFRLRPRADEEMDQELEAHLQLRIDDLVRSGMSAEAAAREARSRFGDFDTARRQLHRAARDRHARLHSRDRLGALWSDARGAFHQLRRARGFAVLAMLTLALGIGVATMMFTLVERILLRPLPFPAAEQPGFAASASHDRVRCRLARLATRVADPRINRAVHVRLPDGAE